MRLLWQEAISPVIPAALRALGVNITAHIFSTPLEIEDQLYAMIDSGINHEPRRLAEPPEEMRLGTLKPSEVKFACLFFRCNLAIYLLLYVYFFFLSPWARSLASLCTWQSILPHNSHVCKLFQLKYLTKVYSQFLVLTPNYQEKVCDWPSCPSIWFFCCWLEVINIGWQAGHVVGGGHFQRRGCRSWSMLGGPSSCNMKHIQKRRQ